MEGGLFLPSVFGFMDESALESMRSAPAWVLAEGAERPAAGGGPAAGGRAGPMRERLFLLTAEKRSGRWGPPEGILKELGAAGL